MPDDGQNIDSDLSSSLNLMSYRLEALERKFDETLDKLVTKIDQLIEQNSQVKERQLLNTQAINVLNKDFDLMAKKVESLDKDMVGVRVTIAQKLAFGGLGGAIAVGIIKMLELAAG
jgi:hypothetical protein